MGERREAENKKIRIHPSILSYRKDLSTKRTLTYR